MIGADATRCCFGAALSRSRAVEGFRDTWMRDIRTLLTVARRGAVLASSLPASETRVIVALLASNMRRVFAELAKDFTIAIS
jgi:hypothetical protein